MATIGRWNKLCRIGRRIWKPTAINPHAFLHVQRNLNCLFTMPCESVEASGTLTPVNRGRGKCAVYRAGFEERAGDSAARAGRVIVDFIIISLSLLWSPCTGSASAFSGSSSGSGRSVANVECVAPSPIQQAMAEAQRQAEQEQTPPVPRPQAVPPRVPPPGAPPWQMPRQPGAGGPPCRGKRPARISSGRNWNC